MTMVRSSSLRLKAIYACLTFLLLSIMPVFAQEKPPSPEDMVAKMQTKLNLTKDQVMAVMPIVEKYASKRDELRQSMDDGTADRDSLRKEMKQLRDDEKQDLSQVLSADQLSQWEKMQRQGRHKHAGGDEPQHNEAQGKGPLDSAGNKPDGAAQ